MITNKKKRKNTGRLRVKIKKPRISDIKKTHTHTPPKKLQEQKCDIRCILNEPVLYTSYIIFSEIALNLIY